MPATSSQTNSSALCSTLTCLLETISSKGYWTNPKEDWEPILACVAVDVLMDAGLRTGHCWVVQQSGHCRMGLEASLVWLNGQIQADGRFGTDFWDSCRLAMTIEKHSLHTYFPNYPELQKYIVRAYTTGTIESGDSDWIGPGFLAAAADYFDRIGRHAEADDLITRLRTMQEATGCWRGAIASDGTPKVPPVWHTAQVVLTLTRKAATEHRVAINNAVTWMKSAQDGPTGKWPGTEQYVVYSTCYAILALNAVEAPDRPAINRGVAFLKGTMRPDGRFHDLGGTLMAAIALLAVAGNHFESDLSIIDHVLAKLAQSKVEAAEREAEAAKKEAAVLKERNDALEKKYLNADFGVTKKQLFVFGPILAVTLALLNAFAIRGVSALLPQQSASPAPSRFGAAPSSGDIREVAPSNDKAIEPAPTTTESAPNRVPESSTSPPQQIPKEGAGGTNP
jgi:outer membrane murein-binding lipoprotein Lpp